MQNPVETIAELVRVVQRAQTPDNLMIVPLQNGGWMNETSGNVFEPTQQLQDALKVDLSSLIRNFAIKALDDDDCEGISGESWPFLKTLLQHFGHNDIIVRVKNFQEKRYYLQYGDFELEPQEPK